ncbi:MAG: thiazole synthase [Bdellovibrionales bacterium]|nr:thiazole synthase [Bdellovibrionales bacterium]
MKHTSPHTGGDLLRIGDKVFSSRLFLGTGKFSSVSVMQQAIVESQSELVTVALRRAQFGVEIEGSGTDAGLFIESVRSTGVDLLPNTSGVRDAREAIFAAELAREALGTNWVKLEIHPDPRYLLPDPVETLKATQELVRLGFVVLPYIGADPVVCRQLEDLGAAAVMPLGSPIGSNKGLTTREMIRIIVEQSSIPVVVDAGLGVPSHASEAFELGVDAVLVNTAIAIAKDPVKMAVAFRLGAEAGRLAYQAERASVKDVAEASSPLTAFLAGGVS